MGIYLSKTLKEAIDIRRRDIPRSKYISRILERQLDYKKDVENQQSQSRPLPGQNSANPLSLSHITRCDEDAADDRYIYTPDISIDISLATTCYSVGCNNPATVTIKIPLRQSLCCVVHLISQGIYLIQNTNLQQYLPSCIRAEIIENPKTRTNSVPLEPTGVNLPKGSLNQHSSSRRARLSSLENQKAESFLDVLLYIPFAPLYIHKLQLMLYIDKQYYQELSPKEGYVNRAKRHEEIIGRRHVKYILSPNGSVEIYVRSSDTPFKLETDGDEITIFSFLGQVRDRLLHCIADIRERSIPPITEWILKECDLNKDIRIDEKAQLTLPDIQLKTAASVFRLYIKSLQNRAVCRAEESLKLDLLLPEALDNIRHLHESIESKLLDIDQQIKNVNAEINKRIDNFVSQLQNRGSNSAIGGQ
jgi:hypothetical protein